MRLVLGFIAVCMLMAGVVAWQLTANWTALAPAGSPDPELGNASLTEPGQASNESSRMVAITTRDVAPHPPDRARVSEGARGAAEFSPPVRDAGETPARTSTPVRWARPEELREARRRLERSHAMLRTDPDHEPALRDQLAALVALGRWSDAAETQGRLVQLHPDDNRQRFEHGTLLVPARRWADAVAVLNEVVAREPEHARAWFNLATAHQAAGHLEEALTAWNRAVALAPEPQAFAARGEVLLDQRDWEAAAADFERVLATEPTGSDTVLNLALAYWKAERVERARALLVGHVQAHPRDVPALLRLADMAWAIYQADPARQDAQRQEVITWCRQALAVEPEQPHARELLNNAERPR